MSKGERSARSGQALRARGAEDKRVQAGLEQALQEGPDATVDAIGQTLRRFVREIALPSPNPVSGVDQPVPPSLLNAATAAGLEGTEREEPLELGEWKRQMRELFATWRSRVEAFSPDWLDQVEPLTQLWRQRPPLVRPDLDADNFYHMLYDLGSETDLLGLLSDMNRIPGAKITPASAIEERTEDLKKRLDALDPSLTVRGRFRPLRVGSLVGEILCAL